MGDLAKNFLSGVQATEDAVPLYGIARQPSRKRDVFGWRRTGLFDEPLGTRLIITSPPVRGHLPFIYLLTSAQKTSWKHALVQ